MLDLSISNLFQTHPSTDFKYVTIAFSFIIAFFLGSFILEYIRRKKLNNNSLKKALKFFPTAMWIMALIALVMTWTRLEGLPYLSMRIWWVVLLLFNVFFIYRIIKKYKNSENTKKHFSARVESQDSLKKYLPKKKKKKK